MPTVSESKRHIVALGGGGFTGTPSSPGIEEYFLRLTGKRCPKVCFIPTASRDAETAVLQFYRSLRGRAEPSDLALFQRTVDDVRGFILSHDAIYVGGGNTANLLAIWQVHGVGEALRAAWEAGI